MKKVMTLLFLLVLFQLPASTIIVNSLFGSGSDKPSRDAAAAVEDGLADFLFDAGFIMFSAYNAPGFRVEGARDARYMITIEADAESQSVDYRLVATVNGMLVLEGTVDSAGIEGSGSLDKMKIYYLIGKEVGAKVSRFF